MKERIQRLSGIGIVVLIIKKDSKLARWEIRSNPFSTIWVKLSAKALEGSDFQIGMKVAGHEAILIIILWKVLCHKFPILLWANSKLKCMHYPIFMIAFH